LALFVDSFTQIIRLRNTTIDIRELERNLIKHMNFEEKHF